MPLCGVQAPYQRKRALNLRRSGWCLNHQPKPATEQPIINSITEHSGYYGYSGIENFGTFRILRDRNTGLPLR